MAVGVRERNVRRCGRPHANRSWTDCRSLTTGEARSPAATTSNGSGARRPSSGAALTWIHRCGDALRRSGCGKGLLGWGSMAADDAGSVPEPQGRRAGLPYDFRRPTAARIRARHGTLTTLGSLLPRPSAGVSASTSIGCCTRCAWFILAAAPTDPVGVVQTTRGGASLGCMHGCGVEWCWSEVCRKCGAVVGGREHALSGTGRVEAACPCGYPRPPRQEYGLSQRTCPHERPPTEGRLDASVAVQHLRGPRGP
jgi:hypothetical protein